MAIRIAIADSRIATPVIASRRPKLGEKITSPGIRYGNPGPEGSYVGDYGRNAPRTCENITKSRIAIADSRTPTTAARVGTSRHQRRLGE